MRGALISRVVGAVVLGLAGWQGGEALGDAVDSPGSMPWGLALAIAGVVVGAALTPYAVILPLRRMLGRCELFLPPLSSPGLLG